MMREKERNSTDRGKPFFALPPVKLDLNKVHRDTRSIRPQACRSHFESFMSFRETQHDHITVIVDQRIRCFPIYFLLLYNLYFIAQYNI